MVDVRHSRHGDEGEVMQEPSDDGVETGVVDVVDVGRRQFVEFALPPDYVPGDEEAEDAERCGGGPVDDWIAEEEVFDGVVVPRAHAKTDVENGPLPELGGEIILFVGVRNKRIIGCHHSHVEMDKVLKEG